MPRAFLVVGILIEFSVVAYSLNKSGVKMIKKEESRFGVWFRIIRDEPQFNFAREPENILPFATGETAIQIR